MQKLIKNPWAHIIFLMILLIIVFSFSTNYQLDDAFLYQDFAKTIIEEGRVDFSIPGFHGPSFFAAIVYLFTKSQLSINFFETFISILTIPIIYLAVKELFKDDFKAILASYIYVLMPALNLTSLRGWSWTSTTFFTFLTIYLIFKKPKLSWITFGIAMIIKAFPVAIAPLFIYKKRYKELALSFIIPIVYVVASYIQVGGVYIGAHPGLTSQKLFDLTRIPANMAFAFQSYLSVHNYTPFNPVHFADMIHFSPFISIFALLAVAYYKKYFTDKRLFLALLGFSFLAFIVPASFYYYDRYYFTLFDLSLIILAVAVIPSYKRLIPIVALSFSFQFFYFHLEYKELFWPKDNLIIFIVPFVIFVVSILYILYERKKIFSTNNE